MWMPPVSSRTAISALEVGSNSLPEKRLCFNCHQRIPAHSWMACWSISSFPVTISSRRYCIWYVIARCSCVSAWIFATICILYWSSSSLYSWMPWLLVWHLRTLIQLHEHNVFWTSPIPLPHRSFCLSSWMLVHVNGTVRVQFFPCTQRSPYSGHVLIAHLFQQFYLCTVADYTSFDVVMYWIRMCILMHDMINACVKCCSFSSTAIMGVIQLRGWTISGKRLCFLGVNSHSVGNSCSCNLMKDIMWSDASFCKYSTIISEQDSRSVTDWASSNY